MDLKEKLAQLSDVKNGFIPVRNLANTLYEEIYDKEELLTLAYKLYEAEAYQIRAVAVFLLGRLSANNIDILEFLKSIVSNDDNWRVQEILAKAFDNYCSDNGYKESLHTIEEWLNAPHENSRRAASEGLRIWTNRPYFKDNPVIAIQLLSLLKDDSSEYVRKSCGNALRDISKNFPDDVLLEISKWNKSKEAQQIISLIHKNKKLLESS